MSNAKMHAEELDISVDLVKRLLAAQFPEWAELSIERVRSAGTDNAIFRLGQDMAVRMPRIGWAIEQVEKEQRWLPKFACQLPLAIPAPLGKGWPGEGYPWNWSIYRWLAGENATMDRLADPHETARDLANFVKALWKIDTTDGPLAEQKFARGVPLAMRDAPTREAIAALDGMLDTKALTAAWEAALAAPTRNAPPVWAHGDLQSGNLLASRGRLSAVIDFGMFNVGDPACDLMVAWNLFPADVRATYRAAIGVDDATWARGRGWALSVALVALPYYRDKNPELAGIARHTIEQTTTD